MKLPYSTPSVRQLAGPPPGTLVSVLEAVLADLDDFYERGCPYGWPPVKKSHREALRAAVGVLKKAEK